MRLEIDSFGKVEVPSDAYYGSFTQRAMNNFPVSGIVFQDEFIKAYAILKRSAALANAELGGLDQKTSKAIVKACDEIIKGMHGSHFPVDVFQAGAGTSTNMNLNEVIANRALELLGHKRGNYRIVNPNDHVNMSQSTNDTFQSATHIAAYTMMRERLIPSLESYQKTISKKSTEFSRIIKSGRTHLKDAVPITLGQEFSGYSVEEEMKGLRRASDNLLQLSVGGTAVGTGLNTYPKFKSLFFRELDRHTGYGFTAIKNNFAMTQNLTMIAEASAAIKDLCLKLIKTANDIRLMSSGPYTGLDELSIPEVQPGSSIMPGKINPSMAEMLTMVCFRAIGNDFTITMAAQAGQFELNVFCPVAAYCLLESIGTLSNAVRIFDERCMRGVKPNREVLEYYFEHSSAMATALSPVLGYSATAKLVKESIRRKTSVRKLVLDRKLLTSKELDGILDPSKLTKPNLPIRKRPKATASH
ncbi:MAG: aspartate ammonia-lyase [Candidatus Micrarchaeaceae archaeon]